MSVMKTRDATVTPNGIPMATDSPRTSPHCDCKVCAKRPWADLLAPWPLPSHIAQHPDPRVRRYWQCSNDKSSAMHLMLRPDLYSSLHRPQRTPTVTSEGADWAVTWGDGVRLRLTEVSYRGDRGDEGFRATVHAYAGEAFVTLARIKLRLGDFRDRERFYFHAAASEDAPLVAWDDRVFQAAEIIRTTLNGEA